MGGNELASSTTFKYLGSIIQSDWEIDEDKANQVQVKWLKYRAAIGVP